MRKLLAILAAIIFLGSPAEAKLKYAAPNPTTEFDLMDYAPLYPTYSWEPLPNTEFYLVQVLNSAGEMLRELLNAEALSRVTDSEPFTEVGEYYWRVCVVDKNKKRLSEWSEPRLIKVTAPVEFAALGDSITHGGANFIPSGQLACQWETFCGRKVKNLGRSGDTTEQMIARFERDVLPFEPRVLLIMGGVNDMRIGIKAEQVISNYEVLRDKCRLHGIEPVFCTITPMNNEIMRQRGIFFAEGWKVERQKINAWILENGGIEVTDGLSDDKGELRAEMTPDGLHPHLRGKMLMGRAIGEYLAKNYRE